MPNLTPQQKIDIYKHLFRGREDVFVSAWEKADKSAGGYTPGLGEALAAKDVYDIWSESGGRGEEKLAATAETGAETSG